MKRTILLSLAGLTLVAACTDNPTRPTDAELAPQGRLTPQGPVKDDIANNLDANIDAAAEVMPLTVGGADGTTQLNVTPRNGDGKNGCNLTSSTTLVVSVSSSNPAVATVSPATVTFGSCSDLKTLTITPVSTGSTTITLSLNSNNTGGTFNLAPGLFTVNVTPPPNTAPTVTVAGVSGGTSYNKGSVPAATCNVIDAEDGNSSFAASLSSVTGTYASDGIGQQTASCSYTDGGGLVASSSLTYSIIDPSAPSISYVLDPTSPDGDKSWYKSNVTLKWTVTESESPNSLAKTGCVDQNITADQLETAYSCSATSAGGSATAVEVKIKRDGTAPSVDYTSESGTSGNGGWYTSPVIVTFTATDVTSGVNGSATATASSTSAEGASVQVGSPAFSDNAGNNTPADKATSPEYKIDLTDPTGVTFAGALTGGGSYFFDNVPTAPTCTATDAVSGLAGCAVTGYSAAVGTHTLTATASDNAGRTATATLSYTVNPWTTRGFYQPVDMTPVGGTIVYNTVKGGSTVPLKFNVYAGQAGTDELTTTTAIAGVFSATRVTCDPTASEDVVEQLSTTGGTSLRYDATARQFIQNWQTPKNVGYCYKTGVTTKDGSTIWAYFKLK